ncbi:hypothetical protein JTE90_007038 [Oedothorax gibbosus]|uniref:Uncharacterized protein n=1 Tax=Oedothorax gibbosus TaxID=931172 RepID=A0AAV6U7P7_9ARAC|nr:hypothetical protein JTE90_007038 [Oedothorax gibbosus]
MGRAGIYLRVPPPDEKNRSGGAAISTGEKEGVPKRHESAEAVWRSIGSHAPRRGPQDVTTLFLKTSSSTLRTYLSNGCLKINKDFCHGAPPLASRLTRRWMPSMCTPSSRCCGPASSGSGCPGRRSTAAGRPTGRPPVTINRPTSTWVS